MAGADGQAAFCPLAFLHHVALPLPEVFSILNNLIIKFRIKIMLSLGSIISLTRIVIIYGLICINQESINWLNLSIIRVKINYFFDFREQINNFRV